MTPHLKKLTGTLEGTGYFRDHVLWLSSQLRQNRVSVRVRVRVIKNAVDEIVPNSNLPELRFLV